MSANNFPMSCEDCKYAILKNEEQVGCSIDKIDKLDPIKDSGKFFQLNKVCLFKNKQEEEVDLKLGYLFIVNSNDKIKNLEYNISLIKDKNPVWIGVIHDDIEYNEKIINILDGLNIKYNIVCNYDKIADLYKLDQFIKNYKNGWTLVNVVGEYFNHSAKEVLENFIINNSGKAAIIKDSNDPEDFGVNNICYFNFIYRYVNGSRPDFNEEEQVYYTKSLYEKISAKDPSMIKTWKEIQ